MIELEILLEKKLASKMEAIAEWLGISLEIVIVMACQKYVRWVEKRGLPKITAVAMGADLIEPPDIYRTEGQDRAEEAEEDPMIPIGDEYRRRR